MDKDILRARFTEILEAYDFQEDQIYEIVEQLVPTVTKLEMYDMFDADDSDEQEVYDDLDTDGRSTD